MQVLAAVAVVAAVEFNDGGGGGVQWRRQRSRVTAVGAKLGDDKAKM